MTRHHPALSRYAPPPARFSRTQTTGGEWEYTPPLHSWGREVRNGLIYVAASWLLLFIMWRVF